MQILSRIGFVFLSAILITGQAMAQDTIVCIKGDGGIRVVEDGSECKSKEEVRVLSGDAGSEPKIVFLSSSRHDADMGTLVGADAICQSLGDSLDDTRTYKALLSAGGTNTDPIHRFTNQSGPYALPNGDLVAHSFEQLVRLNLIRPINRDESGTKVIPTDQGDARAWTGMNQNLSYQFATPTPPPFTFASLENCLGWQLNSPPPGGAIADEIEQLLPAKLVSACNQELHLYCVED